MINELCSPSNSCDNEYQRIRLYISGHSMLTTSEEGRMTVSDNKYGNKQNTGEQEVGTGKIDKTMDQIMQK